jgi:hypothetical protein
VRRRGSERRSSGHESWPAGRSGRLRAAESIGDYNNRNGAIMERPKSNLVVLAMLFFVGVGNLFHFSQHVRSVDVVGLSGGGAACGAALFGFLTALMARIKARRSPVTRPKTP